MKWLKRSLEALSLVAMLLGWLLSNAEEYPFVESRLTSKLEPTLEAWEAIRSGETVTSDHEGLAGVAAVLTNEDALLTYDGEESVPAFLARNFERVGVSLDSLQIDSIDQTGDWGVFQADPPGRTEYRPRISKIEITANGYSIPVALQDDMTALIERRYREQPIFRWSERIFLGGLVLGVIMFAVNVFEGRWKRSVDG